jgi:cellulose synthase/poly-beta-1,6-N-acetylglucosamine synthase-like glycosyltransferase
MNKPIIAVGCPVQNREKIIEEYLEALYNLNYPKDRIIPTFFVNNTSDKTGEIILEWIKKVSSEYKMVIYARKDNLYKKRKDSQDRENRDYTLFTIVRNHFLKLLNDKSIEWDYLFSVDSDIIVHKDILNSLLAHQKSIVSALVYNGMHWGNKEYNYRVKKEQGRKGYCVYQHLPQNIFEVDVTGACYLIKREVIEAGVKYKQTPFGEDIGFCETAKQKGFKLFCDPKLRPDHRLEGDTR